MLRFIKNQLLVSINLVKPEFDAIAQNCQKQPTGGDLQNRHPKQS